MFTSAVRTLLALLLALTAAGAGAAPDEATEARLKAVSESLNWLPPDTETVAVAQDFEMIDLSEKPKDRASINSRIGPGLTFGSFSKICGGDFYRQLGGRRASFAMFGGRKFKTVSAFGGLAYEGLSVLVLKDDLPEGGRPLVELLRKHAREVRAIAGREVFNFDSTITRETGLGVLPDEGTYIALVRPNIVWVATTPNYMQETLARFPSGKSPRALPDDLPEWKHVDRTAPYWMVRHDPSIPKPRAHPRGTKEAVGVAVTMQPAGRNVIEFVYIPTGLTAEKFARPLWSVDKVMSTATITSTNGRTYVSVPLPLEKDLFWTSLMLYTSLGSDFVATEKPSPAKPGSDKRPFEVRFHELKVAEYNIAGAQRLIDDYPGDPRTAYVVLYIANLQGVNRDKEMLWLRKAVKAATPGDGAWCYAQFRIAELLRWDHSNLAKVDEGRAVLESVARHVPDRSLRAARLDCEFVKQCLAEFDFDAAQRHCEKLLSVREVQGPPPDRWEHIPPLDHLQSAATGELFNLLPGSGGPRAERARRIEDLRDRFPHAPGIRQRADHALHQVRRFEDQQHVPGGRDRPFDAVLRLITIPSAQLPLGVVLVKKLSSAPLIPAKKNPDVLRTPEKFEPVALHFGILDEAELADVRAAAVAVYEDTQADGAGKKIGIYALSFLTEAAAERQLEKLTKAAEKPLPIYRKQAWLILVWKDPQARTSAFDAVCEQIRNAELTSSLPGEQYLERLRKLMGEEEFKSAKTINVHGSPVTDAELASLEGLTQLKALNLNDTKVTDAGLAHLRGMTGLVSLCLNHVQMTGSGLIHLTGMKQLQALLLHSTQVTDAGLVHLRGLTQIFFLDLGNTQVTDAGLVNLRGLTRLQYLDLKRTHVTDAGLVHLEGLTRLTDLSLSGTKVTDEGVQRLKKALPNCQIDYRP